MTRNHEVSPYWSYALKVLLGFFEVLMLIATKLFHRSPDLPGEDTTLRALPSGAPVMPRGSVPSRPAPVSPAPVDFPRKLWIPSGKRLQKTCGKSSKIRLIHGKLFGKMMEHHHVIYGTTQRTQ